MYMLFFYQFYRSFVKGYGGGYEVVLKDHYGLSGMGVERGWGRDFP